MIKKLLIRIMGWKRSMTNYWVSNHLDSYCSFLIRTNRYKKINCWGGENFVEMFNESSRDFLEKGDLQNESLMSELLLDTLKCNFKYGVNPEEYFIHDFRHKDSKIRETYLPKSLKDQLVIKQLGDKMKIAFVELKDKYKFYQIAGKYFKREAYSITKDSDIKDFEIFVSKHPRFIAKPIQGRYGKNTAIYNIDDYDGNVARLFGVLLSITSEWIVEELITQDSRMEEWNPTSVNTIRIPSFRTRDGIQILYPFFRMGRKGSVVDNAGSGGIAVSVDAKIGVFTTDGMDEAGNVFVKNPDNGKIIKGWQVPKWSELLAFAKEVHESLPIYHKYVGFDFALTPSGWVLVEGNWGDFICQQSTLHRGLRKEFESMIND